jgi:hypothetical protein
MPLCGQAEVEEQNSRETCGEIAEPRHNVIARSTCDEAIQLSFLRRHVLLRASGAARLTAIGDIRQAAQTSPICRRALLITLSLPPYRKRIRLPMDRC